VGHVVGTAEEREHQLGGAVADGGRVPAHDGDGRVVELADRDVVTADE
jgi:hypothetical protein